MANKKKSPDDVYAPGVVVTPRNPSPLKLEHSLALQPDKDIPNTVDALEAYEKHGEAVIASNRAADAAIITRIKASYREENTLS